MSRACEARPTLRAERQWGGGAKGQTRKKKGREACLQKHKKKGTHRKGKTGTRQKQKRKKKGGQDNGKERQGGGGETGEGSHKVPPPYLQAGHGGKKGGRRL